MSKFEIGDRAWFDDYPVRVLGVGQDIGSYTGMPIKTCEVAWENGNVSTVWQSDLLTDEEYLELWAEIDL